MTLVLRSYSHGGSVDIGVEGDGRKCCECVCVEGEDLTTTTTTVEKKAESPGTYKKNGQAAAAYI